MKKNTYISTTHQARVNKTRFGNNIVSDNYFEPEIYAVAEPIDNGATAKRKRGEKKVIKVRFDEKTLCIYNNGAPADPDKLMDFGFDDNTRQKESSFGTGYKVADSFFTNGEKHAYMLTHQPKGWELYDSTKWPSYETVEGKNNIKKYCKENNIPLPADAFEMTTVCVFELGDDINVNNITKEALGVFYFPKLMSREIELELNGEEVVPITPNGEMITCHTVGHRNEIVEQIAGEDVQFEVYEYKMREEAIDDKFFAKNTQWNGLTIYANGRWVSHEGVTKFLNNKGKDKLKNHNQFNDYVSVVNVIFNENRNNDLPFNNNKTGINWRKNPGKEYQRVLDKMCGDRYRELSQANHEFQQRQYTDKVMTDILFTDNNNHLTIEPEYIMKKDDDCRMDLIVGQPLKDNDGNPMLYKTKVAIQDEDGNFEYEVREMAKVDKSQITQVIEYKVSKITWEVIGQVMLYVFKAREAHKNHETPDAIIYCYKQHLDSPKIEDALRMYEEVHHKRPEFRFW